MWIRTRARSFTPSSRNVSIFEFVREHYESDWMDDERVVLVPEDGRTHVRAAILRRSSEQDLIAKPV